MLAAGRSGSGMALALIVLAASAVSLFPAAASLSVTSPYVRPPPRPDALSLLLQDDDDSDGQTPQQVRLPSWSIHPHVSSCDFGAPPLCIPTASIGLVSSQKNKISHHLF